MLSAIMDVDIQHNNKKRVTQHNKFLNATDSHNEKCHCAVSRIFLLLWRELHYGVCHGITIADILTSLSYLNFKQSKLKRFNFL